MEPPVRVGIMSAAFIARKNIKAINKAVGVEVVAVASRSLEKAKAFAEQQGVIPKERRRGEVLGGGAHEVGLGWRRKTGERKSQAKCEEDRIGCILGNNGGSQLTNSLCCLGPARLV